MADKVGRTRHESLFGGQWDGLEVKRADLTTYSVYVDVPSRSRWLDSSYNLSLKPFCFKAIEHWRESHRVE